MRDPKLAQSQKRPRQSSWALRQRRFSHFDVDRSNPAHVDGPVVTRRALREPPEEPRPAVAHQTKEST